MQTKYLKDIVKIYINKIVNLPAELVISPSGVASAVSNLSYKT